MGSATPWTDAQLADLAAMRARNVPWPDVAKRLGRSLSAVKARLAVSEGRKTNNGAPPNGEWRIVGWGEAPPYRKNDHAKHLRLILEALRREKAA